MAVGRRKFHVMLITPEWSLPPVECTFLSLPGWDGQIGVLARRSPLICELGPGEVRMEIGHEWKGYYVLGGFAEVTVDGVVVLTEHAVEVGQIDPLKAKREVQEALAMEIADPASFDRRQTRLRQARAKMRIARRLHPDMNDE